MYHKLDIHFIPADVLYVNELSLAGKVPYETKDTMEKAITGKIKSKGGILPDDNARIYVPMDLNADSKVISQLEIYDQVWAARKAGETVQKEGGGVRHSRQGIELAKQIVKYLEDIEGDAECFPYDEVEELREAFWL